jgi:EAL domain-containing protein (putative c-di-GMP-specific phosphodiesterase class I)
MSVPALASALDAALDGGRIRSAYQPIVDLDSGAVVAHEALARGPEGTPLARPADLFAAARAEDRTAELDRACRSAAVAGARAADLGADATLFVNVEPSSLLHADRTTGLRLTELEVPGLRIVVEITERALTADPGPLLATIARARAAGMAIAVDDFGAEDAALALLPFIAPDVIKLDLSLIQHRPDAEVARWVSAALAEAERSGATILAEGIETPAHLERARALGARLGQGFHLGRPGPLAPGPHPPATWRPATTAPHTVAASPYEVVAAVRPVRVSTKPMLLALSHHLEALAGDLSGPGVVMSAFQHARHFTPATARRYADLARSCAFAAAFGEGLVAAPVAGVRTAPLGPGDPLRGEWSVVVVGPHEAAALVAQDLGDDGPDAERRFAYVVTHERALVVAAAHALIARL